jgi:hypothetical protein
MEVILSSIIERSNRLYQHVTTVHKALLEIVNLTTSGTQTDGKSADSTHVSTTPIRSKLQQAAAVTTSSTSEKRRGSLSNKSTPQHESSSGVLSGSNKHTSTNSMVYATTPTHGMMELTLHQFGPAGEDVLNHFCKLVSQAVIKAVLHSHSKFLNSLHAITAAAAAEKIIPDTRASTTEKSVKFRTPDDVATGKVGDLHSENHMSIPDPKLDPLLRLTVDVHFATPRIQLQPTLDSVHSDLLEVSDALLRMLHQLKWWARPNAGRTLYDVFEVGAKETAMRTTILRSIQGILAL